MKEIEDDVPPVGYIDDGSSYEMELEQRENAEQFYDRVGLNVGIHDWE